MFGLKMDLVVTSRGNLLHCERGDIAGGGDVLQMHRVGTVDGDIVGFGHRRFTKCPFEALGFDLNDDGDVDDGSENLFRLFGIVSGDVKSLFLSADEGTDLEAGFAMTLFARLVGGLVEAGFKAGAGAFQTGDSDGFVSAVAEGESGFNDFVSWPGIQFNGILVEDQFRLKPGDGGGQQEQERESMKQLRWQHEEISERLEVGSRMSV